MNSSRLKLYDRASRLRLLSFSLSIAAFILPFQAMSEPVDPTDLKQAITERRTLVPEFKRIAKEAKKRGLRVFISGGLAASYGDFVKHQLLSAQGKEVISRDRLANVIYNIALPEQDLDLVVTRSDGSAEGLQDLRDFKAWLDKKIPRRIGGISRWDVIGLKTTDGKHIAVEGNPDFARQNNDSLSIGLIELTQPSEGASVIQEAQHVAKLEGESVFLRDLASDSITFLESPSHSQTQRARTGENPEIIGAIRTLIKAFQFDRKIPADQFQRIREIVQSFDPRSIWPGTYAYNWLQNRAKRLVSHAYDPEAALQVLKEIGLDKKLQTLGITDLSLWLNKAPLSLDPSSQQRKGLATGPTANDLKLKTVAHKTDPIARRLISWRYDGRPRAFISRPGTRGETATWGAGFYTQRGANVDSFQTNNSGTTLVFDVDPTATEGRDFFRLPVNHGVRWFNGSKLKVRQAVPRFSLSSCVREAVMQNVWVRTFRVAPLETTVAFSPLIGGATFVGVDAYKKHKYERAREMCENNPDLKTVRWYLQDFCRFSPTETQIALAKKIAIEPKGDKDYALHGVLQLTRSESFNCMYKILESHQLNDPTRFETFLFCRDVTNDSQVERLISIARKMKDSGGYLSSDDFTNALK
ncbi:MAG: hypothetical protein ACJ763_12935 [Bdellovibrionia bacterium]